MPSIKKTNELEKILKNLKNLKINVQNFVGEMSDWSAKTKWEELAKEEKNDSKISDELKKQILGFEKRTKEFEMELIRKYEIKVESSISDINAILESDEKSLKEAYDKANEYLGEIYELMIRLNKNTPAPSKDFEGFIQVCNNYREKNSDEISEKLTNLINGYNSESEKYVSIEKHKETLDTIYNELSDMFEEIKKRKWVSSYSDSKDKLLKTIESNLKIIKSEEIKKRIDIIVKIILNFKKCMMDIKYAEHLVEKFYLELSAYKKVEGKSHKTDIVKALEEENEDFLKKNTLASLLYRTGEKGTPNPRDVVQGQKGNCVEFATLISMAKQFPHKIKEIIEVNSTDKNEVSVYIYELKSKLPDGKFVFGNKIEQKITMQDVLKEIKIFKLRKIKALWPIVIDVAFEKFIDTRKSKDIYKDFVNGHTSGYDPCFVMASFLGKNVEKNYLSFSPIYGYDDEENKIKYDTQINNIYNNIRKCLKNGKIVVAYTQKFKHKREPQELANELANYENLSVDLTKFVNMVANAIKKFLKEHESNIEEWFGEKCTIELQFGDAIFRAFNTLKIKIEKEKIEECLKSFFEKHNKEKIPNKKFFYRQYTEKKDRFLRNFAMYVADNFLKFSSKESIKKRGILPRHAYAVVGCHEDEETGYKYIILMNPHSGMSSIDYQKYKTETKRKIKTLTKDVISDIAGIKSKRIFAMELLQFYKKMDYRYLSK